MPRYTKMFVVVVALAFVTGESRVGSQERTDVGGFGELTLVLAVPERTFLVLEPIPLTLRLENQTRRDAYGHSALQFSAGRVEIRIQPQERDAYTVQQLSVTPELVGIRPKILRPGEAHQVMELLEVDLDRILPRPGQYSIQAVLMGADSTQSVVSNVATIVLREPNATEQLAQDFIKGSGAARYFFTGLADEQLLLAVRLEEIASGFAGSVFADYANLRLGEISAARGNVDAARGYLSRVATKLDFPLASRASETLKQLSRP